jgi:hypothetical protein
MADSDIKIEFTRHALRKLVHRNIRKKDVIITALNPERIVLENSKFCAYKKFGKFYLKVVFRKLGNVLIIITMHLTDKIKNR